MLYHLSWSLRTDIQNHPWCFRMRTRSTPKTSASWGICRRTSSWKTPSTTGCELRTTPRADFYFLRQGRLGIANFLRDFLLNRVGGGIENINSYLVSSRFLLVFTIYLRVCDTFGSKFEISKFNMFLSASKLVWVRSFLVTPINVFLLDKSAIFTRLLLSVRCHPGVLVRGIHFQPCARSYWVSQTSWGGLRTIRHLQTHVELNTNQSAVKRDLTLNFKFSRHLAGISTRCDVTFYDVTTGFPRYQGRRPTNSWSRSATTFWNFRNFPEIIHHFITQTHWKSTFLSWN